MWFVLIAILVCVCVWQAWRRGPNAAVGTTVLLSLLVPVWLHVDIAGLPANVQTIATISALGIYCVHPRAAFRTRLIWTDFVGIALVVTHLVSDWNADGFHWSILLRAYGEWVVPYLAGRVAVQSWDDARELLPIAVVVCCVLALAAVAESLTGNNPFEWLVGERPIEGTPRHLTRWGFRRAYVTTMNPIFFGNLSLLLFPWTMLAAVLAYRRVFPWILVASPLAAILAVVSSGSRAPLLALFPLTYIAALVVWPHWRRWLLVLGGVAILLVLIFHRPILDALNHWSNKFPDLPPPKITVAGEEVPYTGTMHRFYLIRVYSTAMKRAGWLGFGTERTTGFPPRVPVGPEHVETLKRLWCIDNFYVLFILRFGYAGVACFLLMVVSAAVALFRLGDQERLRRRAFVGFLAGALAALILILSTVWMPYDFGFLLIWTIGLAAGLCSHEVPEPRR